MSESNVKLIVTHRELTLDNAVPLNYMEHFSIFQHTVLVLGPIALLFQFTLKALRVSRRQLLSVKKL